MKASVFVLLFVGSLIPPIDSLAHGGRTDGSGCHTNRKTGDYHCHNSGSRSSSYTSPSASSEISTVKRPPIRKVAPVTKTYSPKPTVFVMRIQTHLLGLGYYKGSINGLEDNDTRLAIGEFQKSEGMAISGKATEEVLIALERARQSN